MSIEPGDVVIRVKVKDPKSGKYRVPATGVPPWAGSEAFLRRD